MSAGQKLLLVEDEARMAQALSELLRLEGYEVELRTDGPAGLEAVQQGSYDIIILDVMLPGLSGLEIARAARAQGIATPILMLTARSGLDDKVEGLDSGADDYLTKPFQARELLARLRAMARRGSPGVRAQLAFGDLSLEPDTFLLRCSATGQSVRLSRREYRMMELLLANQGQVMAREQLALKIWGYESQAEYNNVEVYLSFVRKKLAFIGSGVEIKALRGLGYELRYSHV